MGLLACVIVGDLLTECLDAGLDLRCADLDFAAANLKDAHACDSTQKQTNAG